MERNKTRGSSRAIVIAIVALYVWSLLAAFGGFGTGVQSASAEYQYEDKVTICHHADAANMVTITISSSALDAHLKHGDTIGPCA
jgi:hypothetical protein